MKHFFVLLFFLLAPCAFAVSDATQLGQVLSLSATGTSTVALNVNYKRNYLLIQNRGSASVYVKVGSAHSASEGVEIIAGGNWEPSRVPINTLYLKSASGTQSVEILEGVSP